MFGGATRGLDAPPGLQNHRPVGLLHPQPVYLSWTIAWEGGFDNAASTNNKRTSEDVEDRDRDADEGEAEETCACKRMEETVEENDVSLTPSQPCPNNTMRSRHRISLHERHVNSGIYPYNAYKHPFTHLKQPAEVDPKLFATRLQRLIIPTVMPTGLLVKLSKSGIVLLRRVCSNAFESSKPFRRPSVTVDLIPVSTHKTLLRATRRILLTPNRSRLPPHSYQQYLARKIRALIELKSLRLLDKQRLLRSQVAETLTHGSLLPLNRPDFRRFRKPTIAMHALPSSLSASSALHRGGGAEANGGITKERIKALKADDEEAIWCSSSRSGRRYQGGRLQGNPAQRRALQGELRVGHFQVLLTTYEYIIKDRPILCKIKWLHMISMKVTWNASPEQPHRIMVLLNFVLPKIFNSVKSFDEWFNTPFANSGTGDKIELDEEEALLIIRRLHKRASRQGREGHQSPHERAAEQMYKQMKKHKVIADGNAKTGAKPGGVKGLSNELMQLRKICQHPFLFESVEDKMNPGGLVDDKLVRNSGKIELLNRILPKFFATGHRVLIFFQMTKVMDIMADFLTMMGWKFFLFNAKDSEYKVFILSTRAGVLDSTFKRLTVGSGLPGAQGVPRVIVGLVRVGADADGRGRPPASPSRNRSSTWRQVISDEEYLTPSDDD
ncbi:hypothetical protein B0H13DRAFT_2574732 [Mycena leptocephala]|nr:hypothetical protein B0H13DRAFT_2574732 [Mycena leptocephala]